jgi:hypothetical protein
MLDNRSPEILMERMEKIIILFIGSIVKEEVVLGFIMSIKRSLNIDLLNISKISK